MLQAELSVQRLSAWLPCLVPTYARSLLAALITSEVEVGVTHIHFAAPVQ